MDFIKKLLVVLGLSLLVAGLTYLTGISHVTYTFMKGFRFIPYSLIFYFILSFALILNLNYFLTDVKIVLKLLRSAIFGYMSSFLSIEITEIILGAGSDVSSVLSNGFDFQSILGKVGFPLLLLGWFYGILICLGIQLVFTRTHLLKNKDII